MIGQLDTSVPGTANYQPGGAPDYRALIAQAMAQQPASQAPAAPAAMSAPTPATGGGAWDGVDHSVAGTRNYIPGWAPPAGTRGLGGSQSPFNPGPQYQIDEVTSDPAADPAPAALAPGPPSVTNPSTALGFMMGDFDAAINAPTPNTPDQIAQTTPAPAFNLEAPSPNQQALNAYNTMNSQQTALDAQAARNSSLNDMVQEGLNDAIAANAETGGFGTGTGFSSAAAANDAVAGALADAGNAAGVTGLGEGGGGGGGAGGGGSK